MLNAPEERSVGGVKELWVMAMQPGFVVYATFVVAAGRGGVPLTRFTRSSRSRKCQAAAASTRLLTRVNPLATGVRLYRPPPRVYL